MTDLDTKVQKIYTTLHQYSSNSHEKKIAGVQHLQPNAKELELYIKDNSTPREKKKQAKYILSELFGINKSKSPKSKSPKSGGSRRTTKTRRRNKSRARRNR